MSFANEVKEFLQAYTTIRDQGRQDRKMDLDERKFEADEAYREAMLELQGQKVEIQRQGLAQRAAAARRRGSGTPGDTPLTDEQLASGMPTTPGQRAATARANEARERQFDAILNNSFGGMEFNPDLFSGSGDPDDVDWMDGYARGGMVKRRAYNRGGMVDEEERPQALPLGAQPAPAPQAIPSPMGEALPQGAQPPAMQPPATSPRPEMRPQPEAAPPTPPEASAAIEAQAGEVVDKALKAFGSDAEKKPAAIGDERKSPDVDLVRGTGGIDLKAYREIEQRVDPDGTMEGHIRSAAVVAEGYRFFASRGDEDKAIRFAQGLIVSQKQMSQTLAQLGTEAVRNGDLETACRLVSDACDKFPSGYNVQFGVAGDNTVAFRITHNGEPLESGNLNTAQFLEVANGISNGSMFMEQVMNFGAQYADRKAAPERAVDAVIDARFAADDANRILNEAKAAGVSGAELRELNEAAQAASRRVTEARNAASRLGINRNDLNDAVRQALDVRPPNVPEELMEERGSGGSGFLSAIGRAFTRGPGSSAESRGALPVTPDAPAPTPAPTPAPAPAPTPAPVTPQGNTGPVRVTSQAEFNALPSGTQFIAPDGSVRIKP